MQSTTRRAVLVTPRLTALDHEGCALTPADAFAGGLDQLVARIADRYFEGEGVVLLDADATAQLEVRESWITVDGASWRAHVGALPLIEWCPLIAEWNGDTAGSFRLFHELTGVAYHRSPGVAGLAMLQALHPRGKARTAPVVWESDGPADASERQWSPRDWRRDPEPGARYVHGYDRRRAGLASMNTVHVARFGLRHTGLRKFDKGQAGWWLCEVPAWNDPRMPDPAGYDSQRRPVRWLTTPTVELLNALADEGVSEGVRFIHDSWTSARSRLFQSWAERVERAWQTAQAYAGEPVDPPGWLGRDQDAARVLDVLSALYRETAGMFAAPTSWAQRPDWFAAIKANERAAVWRKAWAVGKTFGRWPVRVDGDKLWYPSTEPDAERAVPAGIALGEDLGEWRTQGTEALA